MVKQNKQFLIHLHNLLKKLRNIRPTQIYRNFLKLKTPLQNDSILTLPNFDKVYINN